MSGFICIKVPNDTSIAKAAAIIRPIEPLPISEISKRIKNSEYLLSYKYTSDEGVKNIIHCYDEFIKLGITPTIFEHDRISSIEFLHNLNNTYQEISAEIDAEIEAEEDEED